MNIQHMSYKNEIQFFGINTTTGKHLNLNNLEEAYTCLKQFKAKIDSDDVEDVKKKPTFLSTCGVEVIINLKDVPFPANDQKIASEIILKG
ncbi:Hypothetical predicted protein [Octopus vulgaris]|uniref:Uncharacterized protein n=1 Tax=Octopus vulgaris TaxID=6645 RepID=A0AA36FFR3_OCTVU|nr:Hypothetical predicted protein [Octopus vulgaris]